MQDDMRAGGAGASQADSSRPIAVDEDLGSQDADQDGGDELEKHERSPWSFLREMSILFVIALAIALLIKTFFIQPFFIPSSSMEDTLLIGDKVLVNKFVYHLRPIQRGDIVVFNGTGAWDPPVRSASASHNPVVRIFDQTLGALIGSIRSLFGTAPGQIDYIKRVIGVPGDHVVCCNAHGQITVNGVPLRETYLIPGAQPSVYHFDIVVLPGRLWVLGDDRPASADSRLHHCGYLDPQTQCAPYDREGTIPEDDVVGRAFLIVWPLSRLRILPIPQTFSQPGLSHAAGGLPKGGIIAPLSAPFLPLTGGLAAAVPLTVLRRRVRRRRRMRLRQRVRR